MQFFHVSQGPIAQLVEQLTFNQLVPRSSRGRSTIFCSMRIKYFALLGISLIGYEIELLMLSFICTLSQCSVLHNFHLRKLFLRKLNI